MGSDSPLILGKEFALQLARPLTVLAASDQIEALRARSVASWVGDADFREVRIDEPIDAASIEDDRIAIIQVDPSVPQSIDRVATLRRQRPDVVQIVALDKADARLIRALLREGVADVVGLPLDPEEILQAAVAVAEVSASSERREGKLGSLVAITRSSGGGGATTIATHLASELAADGRTCCIVDLDVQFGQVSEYLGVSARRTLADLIEAGGRLDSALIQSVAVKAGDGVSVIAAPFEIIPVEAIESAAILSIVGEICREFDYVVLDMPADMTNWGLSLLARTDLVVLLTDQSLASLRQARRRVDLFRNVGIDMNRVAVVANRVERKLFGSLGLGVVAEAVGHDVSGGISLDDKTVKAAQERGVLAGRVKSGSAFVTDLAKIGETIRARIEKARAL